MPNTLVAEELLSLVTPRDRAVSIAGDLTEEAARYGAIWFAGALAGVVSAMFFGAFGRAKLRTAAMLVAGLTVWAVLYLLLRVGGLLLGIEGLAAGSAPPSDLLPPAMLAYLGGLLAAANFLTGLVIGRAGGSSLPSPVMPLALFWAAVAAMAFFADLAAGRPTGYCTLVYVVGVPAFYIGPLLAGGVYAARRAEPVGLGTAR